jgi:hypothetical protein
LPQSEAITILAVGEHQAIHQGGALRVARNLCGVGSLHPGLDGECLELQIVRIPHAHSISDPVEAESLRHSPGYERRVALKSPVIAVETVVGIAVAFPPAHKASGR